MKNDLEIKKFEGQPWDPEQKRIRKTHNHNKIKTKEYNQNETQGMVNSTNIKIYDNLRRISDKNLSRPKPAEIITKNSVRDLKSMHY